MNRQILPAILCVVATVCNATTYYVSTTGNDANDGLSVSAAKATIASALAALKALPDGGGERTTSLIQERTLRLRLTFLF